MDFGTIVDRVADYLDRTDLGTSSSSSPGGTKIGKWVNDTRGDLSLKYSFRYLYTEASASTTAGTYRYALPSDYQGHLMVWCANKKLMKLDPREADELTKTDSDQTAIPRNLTVEDGSTIDATTTSGPPDYYFERGMEFDLYPTPGSNYTMKIYYYAQPATWTTSGNYDYLSTFHYEAIIWGACYRGALFLDDIAGQQKFEARYEKSIGEMLKREKDMSLEDVKVRMRTYKDYDLTQFKRLFKFQG